MKNRKKMKQYGLCMGGMFLLVVAALFLPQIVFSMQDKYQMENTKVQTRSSLNISQLSTLYEEQTYLRMKNLVGMDPDSAIVTSMEHEFETDAQVQALLENIFSQEWTFLIQWGILSHYGIEFDKGLAMELSECKKYILYQEDYEKGVALMMWYFDLYMTDTGVRIRLLADSETSHIYYMKITADGLNSSLGNDTAANTAVYTDDGKKVVSYYSGINKELLYKIVDEFPMYLEYYGTYYEANEEGLPEYAENGGWNIDTGYVEADEEIGDGEYHISYWLSYGEVNLEFWFQVAYSDNNTPFPDIAIGIPVIAGRIPEMMQN